MAMFTSLFGRAVDDVIQVTKRISTAEVDGFRVWQMTGCGEIVANEFRRFSNRQISG
jgi:hypothetical protein